MISFEQHISLPFCAPKRSDNRANALIISGMGGGKTNSLILSFSNSLILSLSNSLILSLSNSLILYSITLYAVAASCSSRFFVCL